MMEVRWQSAPSQDAPIAPSTMRQIVAELAEKHELTPEDLRGPSRRPPIVLARHEAMRRIRDVRDQNGNIRFSLPRIGRYFGGRDHTAVFYAVRGGRPTAARTMGARP